MHNVHCTYVEGRKGKIPILVGGKNSKNPRTGRHRDRRRTEGKPVGICVSEEVGGPIEGGMEGPSGSESMGFFLVGSTPPDVGEHEGATDHDRMKAEDGLLGHHCFIPFT